MSRKYQIIFVLLLIIVIIAISILILMNRSVNTYHLTLNMDVMERVARGEQGASEQVFLRDIIEGMEEPISIGALDSVFGRDGYRYSHQHHNNSSRTRMSFYNYIIYRMSIEENLLEIWVLLGIDERRVAKPEARVNIINRTIEEQRFIENRR